MSSERESLISAPNNNSKLPAVMVTYVDYDIMGNVFRAYYDGQNRMVFVVDHTNSPRKPNVLLVLAPDGERKWDDILETDWGVDLETIRPRKDNKYQKLDVEYGNVDAYVDIVRDFQTGADLHDALGKLNTFRDNAVRRNARMRLENAQDIVERTRETIDKTNDSIKELNARMKDLRAKLSAQKKAIGKEPTKQSAAKILRSDSLIEITGEKIERARRRLANARHRLGNAEEDVIAAQNILDLLDSDNAVTESADNTSDIIVPQFKEIITEPKAEEMAEEEVKPLFDKDPEILDEEIAFKPIDFGAPATTTPVTNTDMVVEPDVQSAPAPLSFTPPQNSEYGASNAPRGDFAPIPDVPDVPTNPVLDSMRPVEPVEPVRETPQYDVRPAPATDERAFAYAAAEAPIVQNPAYSDLSMNNTAQPSGMPEYNNSYAQPAQSARPATPMPGVADASAASGFRLVSPIRGASVAPATQSQRKSKLMYYVMLVILIALSIFTLWIYQRSTSQNIPELTAPAKNTETATVDNETPAVSPFVGEEKTTESVEIEPVPEPIVAEPEPVEVEEIAEPVIPEPEIVEPEPVVVTPEPVVEPVNADADVEPTTVEAQSPFLTEPVEQGKIDLISIEPIVNKPAYNVSQQDKMFVAAPEYETDKVVSTGQSVTYEEEPAAIDEAVCSDGALPDANGCCGGEVFTDMEDGTFACCQPVEGGECFAPMR